MSVDFKLFPKGVDVVEELGVHIAVGVLVVQLAEILNAGVEPRGLAVGKGSGRRMPLFERAIRYRVDRPEDRLSRRGTVERSEPLTS